MDSAGAKSVMSNDMKELTEGKEDTSNTIRGHKANLSNPSMYIQSFTILCVNTLVLIIEPCSQPPRHQRSLEEAQRRADRVLGGQ